MGAPREKKCFQGVGREESPDKFLDRTEGEEGSLFQDEVMQLDSPVVTGLGV